MKERYVKDSNRKRIGMKTIVIALAVMFAITGMAAAQELTPTPTPTPTTANISGMKFNDLNGNGIRDPGEPGLANWTIELSQPGREFPIMTKQTDPVGNYIFTGLAPGNYIVSEVMQSGWNQTAPKNGTYFVSINGTDVTGLDFGNIKSPTFANWTAWHEYIQHQPTGRGCFEADYPNPVWRRTTCGATTPAHAAPSHTLTTVAPDTVGNLNDYVAQSVSSINSPGTLIGSAVGSFPSVTGLTSETDNTYGADSYSLQMNSQGGEFFDAFPSGFPVTFNGNPTKGWEQFIFDSKSSAVSFQGVWIEFWLLGYSKQYLNGGSCSGLPIPNGASGTWYGPYPQDPLGSCYFNGNPTSTPFIPATSLSLLSLEAFANKNGNDEALLCVSGGNCYKSSQPASFLNLDQQWQLAEFNVVGLIGLSQAQFNPGTSITVQNDLKDSSGNAIKPVSPCPNRGQTGETNNLNLKGCTVSSSGISFEESTFDYSVSASPSDVTVTAGDTASYSVTLTTLTGPSQPVTLSVSGLPAGASYSFTTNPVTPTTSGVTTTLNIVTSKSGGIGDYVLTIQGADGALQRTTTVRLHVYGSISGTKFNDINGKPGLDGWTITLTGPSGTTNTVTSNGGKYKFDGLIAGIYTIGEVLLPGWIQTVPGVSTTGSATYTVTITSGAAVITDMDFGNKQYSIYGMKFNDLNGNGKKDPGEHGLAGWHIRLVGVDTLTNTPVNREEITDANGNYGFTDVSPGIYQVFEVMQGPNWVPTTPVTVPIVNKAAIMGINVNFGNKQIP